MDGRGRVRWPPARIPSPPEAGLPDVLVWYVVGEEDAAEANAIRRDEFIQRKNRSWMLWSLPIFIIGGPAAVLLGLFKAIQRRVHW